MATTQQAPDPIDSRGSLEPSVIDAELKPVSTENLNEQPPAKDEKLKYNISHDSSAMDLSRDARGQLVTLNAGEELSAVFPASMYGPQAQMYHFGGYENPTGEWEDYTRRVNVEGLEVGSAGVYGENPSLVYHTGYGYSPHMPYGPYYPVTMPLPSVSGDGQLYSPHHLPFSGPPYQQPAPPSMPYLSSSAPISQVDFMPPIDQEGAFLADTANANSMPFGPRPGYHVSYGSLGGGSLDGNSGTHGFYDLQQGFDGFGPGGFWSDWWKSPDGTGSVTRLPSPAASPQPGSQRQRSLYSFGSSVNSYDRWYPHSRLYHGSNFGGSYSNLGNYGRSLIAVNKSTKQGKGNASSGSSNGTLDFLSEQNRGPRANRSKNQVTQQNSGVDCELYNNPNFVMEYKDARFFIIKSYSEDNVHKSIKYGVWASTSNGNRKLNSAYIEAKEKGHPCPIFLFFSVNTSAQFCGVAEMIGPVDFEKSVDYWQQDKWSGQFPVKWHIVKDVPNTLFRHIILENNDNKPVTNSRDTQEVKLEQGQEMLSIFKKHEYELSILDDFDFYEERENALKERKAHEQQQLTDPTRAAPVTSDDEQRNPDVISSDSISQISESFAQAVRLKEKSNVDLSKDKK